jgi:DNA-binding HxlR family transcriptional regulator
MNNIEKKPGCIAGALQIIGDKWTGLILREIFAGNNRFNILQTNLKGISSRTLSQRLDSLECKKIIKKNSFAEIPPRVEYELTKKGEDLYPILKQMAEWGEKYH